ncbi:MAG: lipoprotein insertase outer membrane protein LolB [Syntrophobacteraceae bacterium]
MKSLLPSFFTIIAILLLASACARPPAPVIPPAPTPFDLGLLKERSEYWRDFQSRFRLKVESKTTRFNARSVVLVKGRYFARFETFGPLGQTAALFVSNEIGPALLVPSERVAFTARSPETLIRHFTGISLPFEIFRHTLTASIPSDQLGSIETRMEGGILHAISKAGTRTYDWHFSVSDGGAVLSGLEVSDRGFQARVVYEPPVALSTAAVPGKIRISSTEWNMEVTAEEFEPAREFQPSVFYLPNLPGTRMVDLDKISEHR